MIELGTRALSRKKSGVAVAVRVVNPLDAKFDSIPVILCATNCRTGQWDHAHSRDSPPARFTHTIPRAPFPVPEPVSPTVPLASSERRLAAARVNRYPAMPRAGLAGRRGSIFIAKCQWFLNVQPQHAPSGCAGGVAMSAIPAGSISANCRMANSQRRMGMVQQVPRR